MNENEILTVADFSRKQVEEEIKSLVPKEEMDKLKQHCASLSIQGIDDRMGFDLVRTTRLNIRKQRLAVEKRKKELISPHKDYVKTVTNLVKEVVDEFKTLEGNCKGLEQPITEELARIKAEKAKEKNDRIVNRTIRINRAMSFDQIKLVGTEYVAQTGKAISILSLQDMEEEEWQSFIGGYGIDEPKIAAVETVPTKVKKKASPQQEKKEGVHEYEDVEEERITLRGEFETETGEFYIDTKGSPNIAYVLWLEDKIINTLIS